jgi:hypothetical protein
LLLAAFPCAAQDRPPRLPLNCDDLPRYSAHPVDLGLEEALERAARRELAGNELGYALDWAGREPSPALVPALKRIVETYRCWWDVAEVALYAIEAAGEPVEYFLSYAREWDDDDGIAAGAIRALGVRADLSMLSELDSIVAPAPARGRIHGIDLRNALGSFRGSVELYDRWTSQPAALMLSDVAHYEYANGFPVLLLKDSTGVNLYFFDELTYLVYVPGAIARRVLRKTAPRFPTATEQAFAVARDTLRAGLINLPPDQVDEVVAIVDAKAHQVAFPSNAPPLPDIDTTVAVVPSVCVTEREGPLWLGETRLDAVFSYAFDDPPALRTTRPPFRVPYGPLNQVSGGVGGVSPEVFVSDAAPTLGNPFRVALPEGATVTWQILGQAASADSSTSRCP